MTTQRRQPRSWSPRARWLRAACALVMMSTTPLAVAPVEAQPAPAQDAASHVWLDSSDNPLPFQTHEEIREYLRRADIVDREPIGRGVTGAERLVMDRGGVRVRAAFRSHDEMRRGPFEGLPLSYRKIRDAGILECAAYELSQALGLGRVPPTVWRKIGKVEGSLQIWLENVMTQDGYLEQSLDPAGVARWNRQKRVMDVFDALIANIDRNQGNILVSPEGTLWFIDHTRTFALSKELPEREKLVRCSRDLWLALRDLDEAPVRQRLEPFLRKGELRALFRRRAALVEHIEELIAADGEAAVLFDIDSPTPQASDTLPPLTSTER